MIYYIHMTEYLKEKELEKVVEGLQSTIANQEATIDLQRKRLCKV